MSADNWTVCPRCYKKFKEIQEISSFEPSLLQETLREDYDITTTKEGYFVINYSCQCSKCKYKYKLYRSEKAAI